MNTEAICIQQPDVRKLLAAANGDAALLYIYLRNGNAAEEAQKALGLTDSRFHCAAATLRQLDLWPQEKKPVLIPGERPSYTERDVMDAMDGDKEFRLLYGEVQRRLGKNLNTEELKILLSFVRYLGLPVEVVSLLVSYCKDRARQKGNLRNPSLRTIEKEAYFWAEQGIDTLEEAAVYIQTRNMQNSRMDQMKELLQIRGRNLTAAEEKYLLSWQEMGFEEDALSLAYERTCLNTRGMNWPYMNKILLRWKEKNLLSVEQIQKNDQKAVPKGASGELGQAELEAIRRVLQEG